MMVVCFLLAIGFACMVVMIVDEAMENAFRKTETFRKACYGLPLTVEEEAILKKMGL